MAITQEFRSAVETKDIRLIRIMLKDSLVVDPTFAEFNQMMSFASGLPELFDSHDGEKLKYETSAWTKDYMDEQMVQIVYNFSKERLDLLQSICKHLYKRKETKIEADRKPEFSSNIQLGNKQIGAGVAVAGVAVTVAGVAMAKALVVGIGVVGIVVGGAMIITDK